MIPRALGSAAASATAHRNSAALGAFESRHALGRLRRVLTATARQGPPAFTADSPGGPTKPGVLDYTGMSEDVRPAEGYHPTLCGFPGLRRGGCCSRPGDGYPLS